MITELRVTAEKHTRDTSVIPWWSDVPRLKSRKVFRFKPGMNVLWGPNGVGKSTLIRALSLSLCCEQSGFMAVTRATGMLWFRFFSGLSQGQKRSAMTPAEKTQATFRDCFRVKHDGRVMSFTGAPIGLMAGGAAFDDDFFAEGLVTAAFRGSAGQTTMHRLGGVLKALSEGRIPLARDMIGDKVNDIWRARRDLLMARRRPTIPEGPPTILMDEPDKSLDIPTQIQLWRYLLRAHEAGIQIIVATHSPFLLKLAPADVNWIELEPGYLDKCREALATLEQSE